MNIFLTIGEKYNTISYKYMAVIGKSRFTLLFSEKACLGWKPPKSRKLKNTHEPQLQNLTMKVVAAVIYALNDLKCGAFRDLRVVPRVNTARPYFGAGFLYLFS